MADKGMLITRARAMRKQPSRAERALWEIVRNRQLANAKFRRQFPIDRYIADFACVEEKPILEVDGLSHTVQGQAEYDAERTARLGALGWPCCVCRTATCYPMHASPSRKFSKRSELDATLAPRAGERAG